MDYYQDCMKRDECYKCKSEPIQFKNDYFKKCQEKKKCDACIELPPIHDFNKMPEECGPNVEYSCMKTGYSCPQYNGSDHDWIFSVPSQYNALVNLRNVLYPNQEEEQCFIDDEYKFN